MEIQKIEKNLNYSFKNKNLIEEALTHKSFANENKNKKINNYERLEFLGDTVLNLVITDILIKNYPNFNEGVLSKIRANFVNKTKLAKLSSSLNLGAEIKLGKGESQSSGAEKDSILSDVFEAVFGAIYLDGGFEISYKILSDIYLPILKDLKEDNLFYDYKSRLQEISQEKYNCVPQYSIIKEDGPEHDKVFIVEIKVADIKEHGLGLNKKKAEQMAAKKVLDILL